MFSIYDKESSPMKYQQYGHLNKTCMTKPVDMPPWMLEFSQGPQMKSYKQIMDVSDLKH